MSDARKQAEHERQVLAEMNKCRHFTGIQHAECAAGVNYRRHIGGPDFGWAKHLPCLKDEAGPPCSLREFPTREEADRIVTEMNEACVAALRYLAGEGPLPPGMTVRACRREDIEPWAGGNDE